MTTTETFGPDLTQVKKRQQQMWASGDFHAVATLIQPVADALCESVDLQADWHVLDVACGSGNAAIAAARCGCDVTGIDYVPALLERGRSRADAEGVTIEFLEGDAEAIPFPDDSFDAVLSVYGAMFALGPHSGGGRAHTRLPAGRQDRPGDLDRRRVHRRNAQGRCQVRAARAGRRLATPLGLEVVRE